MRSLLALLEGRNREAADAMLTAAIVREPETLFYFARHFSMLGDACQAVAMLQPALEEGFSASGSMERDATWSPARKQAGFKRVLSQAKNREANAATLFAQSGGRHLLTPET